MIRARIAFLAFVLSTSVIASDSSSKSAIYLEAGSSFSNMMKITKSDDASKSKLGTHQFIFSLSGRIWDFKPEFAYTILPRKGTGDTYKSRLMVIQLPYLITLVDDVDLKFGPSYWMHTISGSGGSVELSNGTGTATFYKPDRSSTAKTLGFTTGVFVNAGGGFGLDFDLNVLSPLSKRRSITAIAQLTWSLYEE